MTVAELIDQLEELDPNVQVVTGGGDHEYFKIYGAHEADAEEHNDGYMEYSEWYPDNGQGEPVKVVVIY